jgi:hypothetical protein
MRHVKMARALAVAAGALCVSAAPAMAATASKNFIANIPKKTISAEKTAKTSGKTEEPQVFKFGTIEIKCQQFKFPEKYSTGATALTSGKVEAESFTELEVGIHFQKCGRVFTGTGGGEEFEPAAFKGKVTIVYHVNGFGEILGNGEGEELEYGKEPKVTVRETAATFNIAPAKQCRVIIPEQTVPVKAIKKPNEEFSAAVYSNVFTPTSRKGFVNNEKESLEIANSFKGLTYRFGEETQCNADQKNEQGTNGIYEGTLSLEIPAGNLGVEEKVEP